MNSTILNYTDKACTIGLSGGAPVYTAGADAVRNVYVHIITASKETAVVIIAAPRADEGTGV